MDSADLLNQLLPFEEYLRATKTPVTAYQYRAHAAHILRFLGPAVQQLDEAAWRDMEAAPTEDVRLRAVRRTAWRAFVEWLKAERETTGIYAPAIRKAGRVKATVTSRDVLLYALYAKVGMPSAITRLRWGNVKEGLDRAELTLHAGHPSQFAFWVTRAWIMAVRESSFPYSIPARSAPVFPAEPEGDKMLSEWRIPVIADRVVDALHRRLIKPWVAPTNLHGLDV
jgi:hypothetical protein